MTEFRDQLAAHVGRAAADALVKFNIVADPAEVEKWRGIVEARDNIVADEHLLEHALRSQLEDAEAERDELRAKVAAAHALADQWAGMDQGDELDAALGDTDPPPMPAGIEDDYLTDDSIPGPNHPPEEL